MGSAIVSAVFSFVRAALFTASAAGTYGVVANIVAGVITAGLAVGTARAFGSMLKPEIPGQGNSLNTGTRIQVAPDTSNRIQVCYGNVLTGGPVCDAEISNQNKTMNYFIVLSEKTDSGTFTIGDQGIRFGDKKLIFGSGANAHIVQSFFDANGTSSADWSGKLRVRVYAGSTQASDQIFPVPGGGTTAVAATTMMPNWISLGTPHYRADDMVFAIVQMDYDAENGLTALEPVTFDLRNTLRSTGSVIVDYMTNSRYGAGIANSLIDISSFTGAGNTTVGGYGDETITYTPSGGGSSTQPRYEINGTLSTANDVSTNIDRLIMASGSYMFFDGKQGKYKGLPNKIYADQANCFVATDDNIVSPIKIQNTDLYQMYNSVEVEYFDRQIRDQRNTIIVEIDSAERNTGEPENKLTYSIDMINNNMSAEILANIDLNQTRLDTVIEFSGDHSFMQVDVGDVIKVTNSTYGFTDKLFRVMRVREQEDELGALTFQIVGMEYADSVYSGPTVTETDPFANVSMPTITPIGPIIPLKYFNQNYGNLSLDPGVYGNVIPNQGMKVFGAGAQLENADLSNTSLANGTTYFDVITPEVFDITDVDIGDYTFTGYGNAGGVLPVGGFDMAWRNNITINYANTTSQVNVNLGGGGVVYQNIDQAPPQLVDTKKVTIDPTAHSLPADMKPQTATIRLQGYSTLDSAGNISRQFGRMGYEVKRITKGEK